MYLFNATTVCHLCTVLGLLHCNGVTVNKCNFGKKEVKCLGYIVSAAEIGVLLEKTTSITDYPVTKDFPALKRFLGMTGYYRQTLPGLAHKTAALEETTARKKKQLNWLPTCNMCLMTLRLQSTKLSASFTLTQRHPLS